MRLAEEMAALLYIPSFCDLLLFSVGKKLDAE